MSEQGPAELREGAAGGLPQTHVLSDSVGTEGAGEAATSGNGGAVLRTGMRAPRHGPVRGLRPPSRGALSFPVVCGGRAGTPFPRAGRSGRLARFH